MKITPPTFRALIALICFSALFSACKKDKPSVSPQQQAVPSVSTMARSASGACLSFATLEEYEAFATPDVRQAKLAGQTYVSLRSVVDVLVRQQQEDSAAFEANPQKDDILYETYGLLLDVLNEDKVVNLYGNLVRVDVANEKVYAISADVPDAYNVLLDDVGNGDIQEFSTDQQVARILAGAEKTTCSDPSPSGVVSNNPHDVQCNSTQRTKKELRYQKAGVYFSLVAEAKNQKKGWTGIWGTWNGTTPSMWINSLSFTPRCQSSVGPYSGSASGWTHGGPAISSDASKTTFRPYESFTRALRTFYFATTMGGCGNTYYQIQG